MRFVPASAAPRGWALLLLLRDARVLVCVVMLGACGAPPTDDADLGRGARGTTGEERAPRATEHESAPEASDDVPAPMRALLDAHNRRRAAHCAPPLAYSSELARHAQAWAEALRERGCAFEHSESAFGENLAGGTSGTLDGEAVTEMWYREVEDFDFRRGGFGASTGHFTQLVWIGTERVGCGTTTCDGLDLWVCNYDPPGNVQGGYRESVRPTSCQ